MSDNNNNWKEREIGALWLKKTSTGIQFLSGTINGARVSIWKNKFYQEGSDQPVYRIYKDEAPAKGAVKEKTVAQPVADNDGNDIPF